MSGVHQRAGWTDPARGLADRLARLLWPEEFDGGAVLRWDSPADYLETIASVLNDYGERATADAQQASYEAQLGLAAPAPAPTPAPDGWMDSMSTMHMEMWPSGQIVLILRKEAPTDRRIVGDPEGMRACLDRFIAHRTAATSRAEAER